MTRPEHPTHIPLEQLSAHLDGQLAPAEQAIFDAHLLTCEQCRLALADLRATVALVRAVPQPALPRSFTLPVNVAPISIHTAREERQAAREPAHRQRPTRNGLRRSMRFVSAIAAVLGLLVILSGFWSAIPFGHLGAGSASETAAPAVSSNQTTSATPHLTTPGIVGTHTIGSSQPGPGGTSSVPNTSRTPTRLTLPGSGKPPQGQPSPSFALPSVLDLSTIEGRLSLGLALVLLGIIGLMLTRRRYRRAL